MGNISQNYPKLWRSLTPRTDFHKVQLIYRGLPRIRAGIHSLFRYNGDRNKGLAMSKEPSERAQGAAL
jgi:hypothetical protein